MDKERFKAFLEDYILSIFTGSEIVGEEKSFARESEVAQGDGGALLIKYSKQDEYRFIIKRIQPFNSFELSIVKSILNELYLIAGLPVLEEYRIKIYDAIIEKAICEAINVKTAKVLNGVMQKLGNWSRRTYEASKVSFGLLISGSGKINTNKNLHYTNILNEDFSSQLSDGIHCIIKLNKYGYIADYITLSKGEENNVFAPIEVSGFAKLCKNDNIGITLLESGDILVFKNEQIMFAKRDGNWSYYSHEEILSRISAQRETAEEIRKAIYLSCLDLSFTSKGGCIVYLNKSGETGVIKHININDIIIENYFDRKKEQLFLNISNDRDAEANGSIIFSDYETFLKREQATKIAALRNIIKNKKFYELPRRLRLELLGIDGATVVDYDGDIVAVGAIIKIEAGSTGGGRLAAAKTLAQYGVAVKVSSDGDMLGFGTRNKEIKPLFYLK